MLNSEDGCIRYLMKEMDPSEEMEFERMMREDENLLIEVETLRNTLKKLDQLPEKTPPPHLIEEIKNSTAYQNKVLKGQSGSRIIRYSTYTAAATVLLIAVSGIYFQFSQPGVSGTGLPEDQTVSPWVDRNEVLRYSGEYAVPVEVELSDEYNKSYDKLRLVESVPVQSPDKQGLILTGSSD
ncbi:hypothetical protein AB2B38_002555 [Balneola sp. MJW-20]|uniref:hypothetical protein n=1 Tax=Gracilimonas aurantiaca TaxID=3234185 RepID=UPI003465C48F